MAVVAWLVAIGAIVAVGAFGSAAAERQTPQVASTPPAPTPVVAVAAAPATVRAIWVDLPGRSGELVTTRDVIIRGRVSPNVATVRILLESRNGKPVASRSIEATGRPQRGLIAFEGRFDLSLARPGGALFALVVAVDADGVPIDAVRRRFQLGEVLEEPLKPLG